MWPSDIENLTFTYWPKVGRYTCHVKYGSCKCSLFQLCARKWRRDRTTDEAHWERHNSRRLL